MDLASDPPRSAGSPGRCGAGSRSSRAASARSSCNASATISSRSTSWRRCSVRRLKSEDLPRQVGGPSPPRAGPPGGTRARAVSGGRSASARCEVADDGGEDVVEVVGDAARQRADRLELLRLAQLGLEIGALRLGALALGNVPHEARVHRPFAEPRLTGRQLDRDRVAALAPRQQLALTGLPERVGVRPVGEQLRRRLSDQVLASAVEQPLGGAIDGLDRPGRVGRDDAFRRRLQNGPQPRLALVQRRVRLLHLGGHRVERGREILELVVARDLNRMREVERRQPARAVLQLGERLRAAPDEPVRRAPAPATASGGRPAGRCAGSPPSGPGRSPTPD